MKTNIRKCGGATVRGQLCIDNISMGLNESNDSSISDSSESLSASLLLLSSSQIFTEPLFSLTSIFLLALYVPHSFFAVFAFSNWSMFLMRSMFIHNLIELNLIPKILGSQNDNADQLSSQYREIRTGNFRENRLG